MALHNRLTHSLKVEQVGVSMHTRLAALDDNGMAETDLYAIAAACLAHDLGHPPFGHAGEQELDSLVVCVDHRGKTPRPHDVRKSDPCAKCKLEDGFEGNAQSLRIVAVLAVHKDSVDEPIGLDLTRASLAATIKYPWLRGTVGKKASKWGAYDCDKDILEWAMGARQDPSLDAQIMDWADDISYAVHDIEDFHRAGLIPLDDYKPETETVNRFLSYVESENALGALSDETKSVLDQIFELFPRARFSGQTLDLAALDKLRGTLLTQFIGAASISMGGLVRDEIQDALNAVLKQLIWYHIIDEPTLAHIQIGQRRVLRDIFETIETYALDAYRIGGQSSSPDEQSLRRLPYNLRRTIEVAFKQESNYTHAQKIYRGILDYMSGLSDAEAYHLHAVLKGREVVGHL